jgi:hypothetical protein
MHGSDLHTTGVTYENWLNCFFLLCRLRKKQMPRFLVIELADGGIAYLFFAHYWRIT